MTFKLARIEEIQTTGAFYAEIQQDGKTVGEVQNDGRGGANIHRFHTLKAHDEYAVAGAALFEGSDVDAFTNYLMNVVDVNRKRTIVAIKSVEEFTQEGTYYIAKGAAVEQFKRSATGRDMLVWDKATYAFV